MLDLRPCVKPVGAVDLWTIAYRGTWQCRQAIRKCDVDLVDLVHIGFTIFCARGRNDACVQRFPMFLSVKVHEVLGSKIIWSDMHDLEDTTLCGRFGQQKII